MQVGCYGRRFKYRSETMRIITDEFNELKKMYKAEIKQRKL
jgi:hypothetical protein